MAKTNSRTGSKTNRLGRLTLAAVLLSVAGVCCQAQPASAAERARPQAGVTEPAFAREAINLLVGFRPGAAYDLYARLSARYMLSYLPGRPVFLVENKPENAIETAKRIYKAAPDGATLAALIPAG